MRITKREILASITIISLMLLIGFFISGKIKDYQTDKNAEYYKAVHIEDTEMFQYGMRTNVGNAYVYGELEAVDTVSYPDIDGEYMYLERIEEHYRRHTRTVRRGERRVTEVYWTWDEVGREEIHSEKIRFLGIEMPYEKINMPRAFYIDTVSGGYNVRYVYNGCPSKCVGTLYTDLRDGTISDGSSFSRDKTIAEVFEQNVMFENLGMFIFWCLWILLTGSLVYGFYYLDNEWLEG